MLPCLQCVQLRHIEQSKLLWSSYAIYVQGLCHVNDVHPSHLSNCVCCKCSRPLRCNHSIHPQLTYASFCVMWDKLWTEGTNAWTRATGRGPGHVFWITKHAGELLYMYLIHRSKVKASYSGYANYLVARSSVRGAPVGARTAALSIKGQVLILCHIGKRWMLLFMPMLCVIQTNRVES